MTGFGKRIDGPGGRRRSKRAPVLMSTAMHTVGASRTVSVIDVSQTGARIRCSLPLGQGEQIWLKIPPNDVFARVRWIDGDHYGVHFEEPLSLAEAERLQARGKVVLLPRLKLEEQLAIEDLKANSAR
jgi:hypothetical protein